MEDDVGKRLMTTEILEIDETFVARLLLGALSEHEQRLLVTRLTEGDDEFRGAVLDRLKLFEMFDLDALAEYDTVLQDGHDAERRDAAARRDAEARRDAILRRTAESGVDLEGLIRDFTFPKVLELGGVTPRFFTWSMAEHLLARSRRPGIGWHHASTSLYLAMMVIDVVELLGSAGHSPRFPAVVADVRCRIREAELVLAGQRPVPPS